MYCYQLLIPLQDGETGEKAFSSQFRLFEGHYDATESIYDFKYTVISNDKEDNQVTIKIMGQNNILNRVLSYKIKFTDERGNLFEKDVYNLLSCETGEALETTDYTEGCFMVPYIDLKDGYRLKHINTSDTEWHRLYDDFIDEFLEEDK